VRYTASSPETATELLAVRNAEIQARYGPLILLIIPSKMSAKEIHLFFNFLSYILDSTSGMASFASFPDFCLLYVGFDTPFLTKKPQLVDNYLTDSPSFFLRPVLVSTCSSLR
jgi:hypothetical protein